MDKELTAALWAMYEDEFGSFLDAEIELLETKLQALKKIREKFREGLKDGKKST